MKNFLFSHCSLRHMKDPDHTDAQGNTMENRMSALLKKIAQDITEAGSACDHYIKKSFVGELVLAQLHILLTTIDLQI